MAHRDDGPLVVHCSAGIGRAGTFIVADMQMQQFDARGTVDISEGSLPGKGLSSYFPAVARVRHERPRMVQTASQYVFLHQVLIEYIWTKVSFCA
jgi:protein tyrosine phosphatase